MTDYTITLTYDREKQLINAFENYRDALNRIDRAEMELIRPIQEQMDERRKQAWQAFFKAKKEIIR